VNRNVLSKRLKSASVAFRLRTGSGRLFQAHWSVWRMPGGRYAECYVLSGTEMSLAAEQVTCSVLPFRVSEIQTDADATATDRFSCVSSFHSTFAQWRIQKFLKRGGRRKTMCQLCRHLSQMHTTAAISRLLCGERRLIAKKILSK